MGSDLGWLRMLPAALRLADWLARRHGRKRRAQAFSTVLSQCPRWLSEMLLDYAGPAESDCRRALSRFVPAEQLKSLAMGIIAESFGVAITQYGGERAVSTEEINAFVRREWMRRVADELERIHRLPPFTKKGS